MSSQLPTYKIYAWQKERTCLPSSKEQFEAVSIAREHLLFALACEQRFDLAIENFAALEGGILQMALDHAIFTGNVHQLLAEGRHKANRHLTNFMSSAKMYVDQSKHAVSGVFGKESEEAARFEKATYEQYDAALGYRTIEALRNYSQHRGLPAHSITFSMREDDIEDKKSKNKHTASVALSIETLTEDGKFKKALIPQLQKISNKNKCVQLMPLIREYMACLGKVHEVLQEIYMKLSHQADAHFSEVRDLVEAETGSREGVVHVCHYDESGNEQYTSVIEGLIDDRKAFADKNRHAKHLSRQYVSSLHPCD